MTALAHPMFPHTDGVFSKSPFLMQNSPLRGMAYSFLSLILFSSSDIGGKYLSQSLPPIEISWIRYGLFCLCVLPLAWRQGPRVLRTAHPWLQIVRSLGLVGSSILFILATHFLPIAEATATHYVNPLISTALSIPILGETVGWRRWLAAVVGLVGVLVIVRPMNAEFQPTSLLPVLSALCSAVGMVLTRKLAHTDRALTMVVWSALIGFLVTTCLLPFGFVMPNSSQIAIAFGVGLVFSLAQCLVVRAYRFADASVLGPFSYCQVIISAILGFIAFHAAPDGWSYFGATLIIGSGLYNAHRTRLRDVEKRSG